VALVAFWGVLRSWVAFSSRVMGGVGWVWLSSEQLAKYLTESLNPLIKIGALVSLV